LSRRPRLLLAEKWNSRKNVNLLVTKVPKLSCNAKTFGLHLLQIPGTCLGSRPAGKARIVPHGTIEMLIKQNTDCDGQNTSCIN
jgi:hypothetical protein